MKGSLLDVLKTSFAVAGFDLFSFCRVSAYNSSVPAKYALSSVAEDQVIVMVGNTRRLWPLICKRTKNLLENGGMVRDPVDSYVEEATAEAISSVRSHVALVKFVHDTNDIVLFQHLACVTGLCWLCPEVKLCVHPVYGPWVSFRVAMVLSDESNIDLGPPPKMVPPLFDGSQFGGPELQDAMAESSQISRLEGWRKWVAVRDAIPIGKEHRFFEDQLRYHYTGEMDWRK